MRMVRIALAVLLIASTAWAETPSRSMTVTGEGRVETAPDMATIRLGVVTEARGAREAIDTNSRAMDGVLDRLRGLGIAARDLQTSDFSVSPRWRRGQGDTPPEISGFVARNLLIVRIRDLDSLGTVLDAVTRDGANTFEGLAFGLQTPGPHEDAARRAAVADARRKAALYAEAGEFALGPLLSLSESGGGSAPRAMARAEMAVAMDAVPVAPGEVDLVARVTLTYAIEDPE